MNTQSVDAMQLLRKLPIMKRQRPTPPIATTPSTPPTPQTIHKTTLPSPKSISHSSKKPRSLLPILQVKSWIPLNLGKSELFLPLTFPTGQTFRWKQTGPFQYTGVVGSHLMSLKQLEDGDVAYFLHQSQNPNEFESASNSARLALLDFLNVGICLSDLWEQFSVSDSRFGELAKHLGGARVLRQDPLECLIQFICSSNNNIKRITQMVDFISKLGNHLGTVEGIDFHEFPSLGRLSLVSEQELREAGFGYRSIF